MIMQDVYDLIDSFAPFSTQEGWDNSGVQIGAPAKPVSKIVLCLDVTPRVAGISETAGADLIVSHHPLFFHAFKSLDPDGVPARLIRSGVNVLSAHTNLDKAPGGVNDTLCEALGLPYRKLPPSTANGFLNLIDLPEETEEAHFAALLRDRLESDPVYLARGVGIRRVAVSAGAADDFIGEALALGCDGYLTGEAHYHRSLDASAAGVTVFTAGHYETEVRVLKVLEEKLLNAFPHIPVVVADLPKRLFSRAE